MVRSPLLGTRLAAGSALAGGLVGCAEAVWRDVSPGYALLLYATLWSLAGMAAGTALAVWPRWRQASQHFVWGAAAAGGLTAAALTRFILWRDVFVESPDKALLATAAGLGAGLLSAALFGAAAWAAHRHLPDAAAIAIPVTACALFAGLAWPRPEHEPELPHAMRPSQAHGVIMIVADALRADALGAYGADAHRDAPPSPNFDALSHQGLLFTNVSAQASWTKPAVASLLTSRYVRGHGTMAKTASLPPSLPTLASELQRHGVFTSAVVTNYNLEPSFGFNRGFDTFEYLPPARYLNAPVAANRLAAYNVYRLLRERLFRGARQSNYFYRSGAWVNAAALRTLDMHPQGPFFLYLHYMEAHDPYFDIDGTSWARVSDPHPQAEAAPAMRRAYRDGVRRFDQALGELLAGLQARGLADKTLMVITADHGEEFGEHGGYYHGTSLYEELLRIPLLVAGSPIAPGMHEGLAQQIDIAPTVLQHFSIDPPAAWEGQNLLTPAHREVAWAEEDHEGNVLTAVRYAPEDAASVVKLIVANADNPRGLPAQALFDLARDPHERTPLAADDPRLQGMRTRLQALQDPNRKPMQAPSRPLDSAAQAELRSLGYVQ